MEADANFKQRNDAIWVLYTIAEAYNYKGDVEKQTAYEEKAKAVAAATNDAFAESSYEEQKAKIAAIQQALV